VFWGKQQPVFLMNQRAMKGARQLTVHYDCGTDQAAGTHEESTQAGDDAIADAQNG